MNSPEQAEAFLRQWLEMIDNGAPPAEFFKYLPDGDFEQWSYPDAEIKNLEHLQTYFSAQWGALRGNRNTVTRISAQAEPNNRFGVVADVDWEAETTAGDTIKRPLTYALVLGSGTSSRDPAGQFAKIYRYKITRR
jgi:hypothetical protein